MTYMNKLKTFFSELWKKISDAFIRPTRKQKDVYFSILRTVVAVAISLGITCIILLFCSKEPMKAISTLFFGPLKSRFWRGEILRGAVPLIFSGVAASLMIKCGQFNMIGEGAFYIGGLTGAVVAIYLPASGFISVILSCLAAVIVASVFGIVPAVLKAKLNVNEFVVSLMLNFVMLWIGMYFLNNFLRDEASGDIATQVIPEANRFGILLSGTYLSTGVLVAIAAAILCAVFLYKTKWGYAIRMTGDNKDFANYSGLNACGAVIYSQIIGAGLGGLGGAVEVLGSMDARFNWKTLPGYGFDGFVVAILAGNNPILVPFAALFLSYLRQGASLMALQTDVATELVQVIQAIIIIIVAGQAFMAKFKNKIFKTKADKEAAKQ